MKSKKIYFSAIMLLSVFLVSCAQSKSSSKNDSNLAFTSIKSNVPVDIVYRQSPKCAVHVDGNALSGEKPAVVNGTLVFNSNYGKKVTVFVTSPTLDRVELNGGGKFLMEGRVTGKTLEIKSSGEGDFHADELRYDNVFVESQGVGNVNIAGQTNNLQITANGVGNVHSEKLTANNVLAHSNGVGNVYCCASNVMDLRLNGVGNVFYSGNPELTNFVKKGVGKIQKI